MKIKEKLYMNGKEVGYRIYDNAIQLEEFERRLASIPPAQILELLHEAGFE